MWSGENTGVEDGASTGSEVEVQPSIYVLQACVKSEGGAEEKKVASQTPVRRHAKTRTQELGFSHIRLHKEAVVIRLLEINRELSVLPLLPLIG